MQVIWKYYYSSRSARDHGTMYQLRNLISRSNVSAHPVKSYNESDDFFRVIVTSRIFAAALKHLHMKSLADVPSISAVEHPEDLWMETSEQRIAVLQSVCENIVDEFVDFEFNKLPMPSTDKASCIAQH